MLLHERVDCKHRGDTQERVAIRLGARDRDDADIAARPGTVVGDRGYLPAFRELRGNETRQNVGAGAGPMRRDQSQRAPGDRIGVLRSRRPARRCECQAGKRNGGDSGRALHGSLITQDDRTVSTAEISGARSVVSRSSRAMSAMLIFGRSGSTPGASITSGSMTTALGNRK